MPSALQYVICPLVSTTQAVTSDCEHIICAICTRLLWIGKQGLLNLENHPQAVPVCLDCLRRQQQLKSARHYN